MSLLFAAQLPKHVATQPLKSELVATRTPVAPCVPPNLGCSCILDATVLSSECAPHTGGGLGGEGGDAGGGGEVGGGNGTGGMGGGCGGGGRGALSGG